jgi:prepilin-type N-terminal cleavage/methylation domain-containing protein
MIKSYARRGFTLIECLVSIVILGLGIVGVVGCFTAALLSNQKAEEIQQATAFAQDTLEDMRSRGFGSVTYDEFPATSGVEELHQGVRTIEITDNYRGDVRLKQVAVEISWGGANQSHPSIRLESLISNRTGHTGG